MLKRHKPTASIDVKLGRSRKGRGATQEFELRSIELKKYISGLRSIFCFQKKHNFAQKPHYCPKLCAKLQIVAKLAKYIFISKSGVT